MKSSLPRFYEHTAKERLDMIAQLTGINPHDKKSLLAGLDMNIADKMVENMIGVFALPLGIATNFCINEKHYLIPMVTEEPSVIAAASAGAKAASNIESFGFKPYITGQIQVLNTSLNALNLIKNNEKDILLAANGFLSNHMNAVSVSAHALNMPRMMKIEIVVDTGEAMGANAVNTMCEGLTGLVEQITGGKVLLRILSNDIPSIGHARAFFDVNKTTADDIINAYEFALLDVSRAVTHNKGIMNGIAAVGMATGQDTRALEAGAHAYAAKCSDDAYGPLSKWEIRNGRLWGELSIPLRVGIVGGLTRHHPAATSCLKILGNPASERLAEIMAAVGLAQNFSALKSLATDGIQKGHMRLHKRRLAKHE